MATLAANRPAEPDGSGWTHAADGGRSAARSSGLAAKARLFRSLLHRRQLALAWSLELEQHLASRAEEAEAELVFTMDRAHFEADQSRQHLPPTAEGALREEALRQVDARERYRRVEAIEGEMDAHRRLSAEVSSCRQLSGFALSRLRTLQAVSALCGSFDGKLGPLLRNCEEGLLSVRRSRPAALALASEHEAAGTLAPVVQLLREMQDRGKAGGHDPAIRTRVCSSGSGVPSEAAATAAGSEDTHTEELELRRRVERLALRRDELRQLVQPGRDEERRQRELAARLQRELAGGYAELARVDSTQLEEELHRLRHERDQLMGELVDLQAVASIGRAVASSGSPVGSGAVLHHDDRLALAASQVLHFHD